jgi:hypothetical protein
LYPDVTVAVWLGLGRWRLLFHALQEGLRVSTCMWSSKQLRLINSRYKGLIGCGLLSCPRRVAYRWLPCKPPYTHMVDCWRMLSDLLPCQSIICCSHQGRQQSSLTGQYFCLELLYMVYYWINLHWAKLEQVYIRYVIWQLLWWWYNEVLSSPSYSHRNINSSLRCAQYCFRLWAYFRLQVVSCNTGHKNNTMASCCLDVACCLLGCSVLFTWM